MRFLLIQENGRHERNRHMRECFIMQRSLLFIGHQCDVWGLGHANYGATPDFNSYDVVINLENYDTGWVPDLGAYNKPVKLLWCIDAHFRGLGCYLQEFGRGKYTKLLQATKTYVDLNSVWFPNFCDDFFIRPMPEVNKVHDVGFCGNYVNRKPLFDELSTRLPGFQLDVGVIGFDMVKAINSYKIQFNKNVAGDINYRSFETLACRTVLLTNYDSQYLELGFEHGINCLMYNSLDEAVDLINSTLSNRLLLDSIANSGFDLLKAKHSAIQRAETLTQIINQI